jgi:hypothetical protein
MVRMQEGESGNEEERADIVVGSLFYTDGL